MKFTRTHIFLIGVLALFLAGGALAGFQLMRAGGDGFFDFVRVGGSREGFESPVCDRCGKSRPKCGCRKMSEDNTPVCNRCQNPKPSCGCDINTALNSASPAATAAAISAAVSASKPAPIAPCPRTQEPDLSKYILKSQVPSTNSLMPDMSNYMLKTECPSVPDLSKYVLKSSIPKPQPVIIDNTSCMKDAGECPPCPRPRCPEVKCPPPTKCAPPAPCPRPVCPPTVVKCKSEESSAGSTVRPFLAPLSMSSFGMA